MCALVSGLVIDDPVSRSRKRCNCCAAWNYYPPLTREQKAQANKGQLPPRLHAHADMDVLTLLYQRKGRTLSGICIALTSAV